MKRENFCLNEMYTFAITIYRADKTNYHFQVGEKEHHISGILFAKNGREALEKLYKKLGVAYGETLCAPNIRNFVTEVIPYLSKEDIYCTGFTTK